MPFGCIHPNGFLTKRTTMKKTLLLSIIALSSITANAQISVKDSIAAAKAAAKAAKAEQAQALKEFKAKQAADLKAFIENQKNGKSFSISTPVLTNEDDSVAYIFGVANSRGLMQHIVSALKVDTAYMSEFSEALMNRVAIDDTDKKTIAQNAGTDIGGQLTNMTVRMSKDYFAADPDQMLNKNIVAAGLLQGLFDKSFINAEEAGSKLSNIMQEREAKNNEKIYGEIRRNGENFLAENKTKEGVITLPSGLQYKVIEKGKDSAERATRSQKVKVNYEGRLIDGTVFDSSYKRGEPTTFQPNQVIKGWTEALMLMPEGAKWELYIPYNLAYGERGQGGNIKPYSTLIFTVELVEIVK